MLEGHSGKHKAVLRCQGEVVAVSERSRFRIVGPDGEPVALIGVEKTGTQAEDDLPASCLHDHIKMGRVGRPNKAANPEIKIVRRGTSLTRLTVVEHEAETVALVSRTLLGAVGDVAAIGGIERRGVSPNKAANPEIKIVRRGTSLTRLTVVEHEAETVALVSRTLLGAVGDVAAIGGIERRGVA